jgi:hypothetical protein
MCALLSSSMSSVETLERLHKITCTIAMRQRVIGGLALLSMYLPEAVCGRAYVCMLGLSQLLCFID